MYGIRMFYLAVAFFAIAIMAAMFGFSGRAHEMAYIGRIVAVVGIGLAMIAFALSRRCWR